MVLKIKNSVMSLRNGPDGAVKVTKRMAAPMLNNG